jgi:hypothetical protein
MNKSILVLGVVAVAAAGWYWYSSRPVAEDGAVGAASTGDMLATAQLFVERSARLSSIKLDTAVLSDPQFRNLRSYTVPVRERPIGRDNPFEPAARVAN